MNPLIPPKLKEGDEIRIIAPSHFYDKNDELSQKAIKNLESIGFAVSFSRQFKQHTKLNIFSSTPLEDRLEGIHQAFADKNIKAVIPITGGFNSNQLLPFLDYNLIKSNPKIFCGSSDITVLNNAIYTKTGMVTYSGPNLLNFGIQKDFLLNHIISYFKKAVSLNGKYTIIPTDKYMDYKDAFKVDNTYVQSRGYEIINPGIAEGVFVGGNLCSFNLLHGTDYMPSLTNKILFVEDDCIFNDSQTFLLEFDRNLQSVLQQPDSDKLKGILIGKFESSSEVSLEMIKEIIKKEKSIKEIPVVANVDIGHTIPFVTIPIGGYGRINTTDKELKIISH